MAALAQQRGTLRQHTRVIRPVGCMAQSAVLTDRRMLPEKRSALLGMTLLAACIQGLLRERRGRLVAMCAVATAAIHLALQQRMRKRLHRFAALSLMAIEANLRLRRGLHDGIGGRVADVTVRTGNFVAGVHAGMPAKTNVVFVTLETYAVLIFQGCDRARAKMRDSGPFLTPADAARVRIARPVAGLALQLPVPERAAGI